METENKSINYIKDKLRLDDSNCIKDYSVSIKNINKGNKRLTVIINLHENILVVIEYYDKIIEKKDKVTTIQMHKKRILMKIELYDDIRGELTEIWGMKVRFPSKRSPLDSIADYQGYCFHDKFWYSNMLNGDVLCPQQVSSSLMNDACKFLENNILNTIEK